VENVRGKRAHSWESNSCLPSVAYPTISSRRPRLPTPQPDPPSAIEAVGTLQVRPNSTPAVIASFSLRAVTPLRQDATTGAAPLSAASQR
jgi:hypothetical protein